VRPPGFAEPADERRFVGFEEKQPGGNLALDASAAPSRMSTTRAARRVLGEPLVSSANFGIRSMGRLSTE